MTRVRHPRLHDRAWLSARYETDGWSVARIAREVGCTGSAVVLALARHDIRKRKTTGPPPRVVSADAVKAAAAGSTGWADLAGRLGLAEATARKLPSRCGLTLPEVEALFLPRRRRSRYPILNDTALLRRMLADGATVAEIGAEAGCSQDTVRCMLRRAGIPTPRRGPTREQILAAAEAATSWRAVMDAVGCTYHARIYRLCRAVGVLDEVTAMISANVAAQRQERRRRRDATRQARHPMSPVQAATLRGSNRARTIAAAAKTVDAAKAALRSPHLSAKHRAVLAARVDHPDANLADLGDLSGVGKHAYAALLRRALKAATREAAGA